MNVHPHGEQLSAYLDGMLDVAQMRAVATHVSACPPCAAALEGLRQTKRLLAAMPAPAPPALEFWTDAYRQMRVQDKVGSVPPMRLPLDSLRDVFREPHRRWSAGLAAAAAAVAIAAPLMYGQPPVAPVVRPPVSAPLPDSVDVSSLVQAHAESAAREPLADTDRQDVIALDDSFASDDAGPSPADAPDSGSDASP